MTTANTLHPAAATAKRPERYRPQLTYQEYLEDPDIPTHTEWVDGEVAEMPSVSDVHDDLVGWLVTVLRVWNEAHGLGRTFQEPFQMKTGLEMPGRSPDVMFLAAENFDRRRRNHLAGPADLVMEVVGPHSRHRDRVAKFAEYQAGGVREYWLLEPEQERADFFRLDGHGVYQPVEPDADGVIRGEAMAGLWLRVEWLWRRPPVMEVMRAWGLV